jgi:acyl-coenzyme A thioesterase PaaI-like protein
VKRVRAGKPETDMNFDVLADARIVRIGRTNCFGRVTLSSAADKRPVGMVSSAYAML